MKFIEAADLQTIDALWSAASGGKFGFSAQREVWLQQSKYWSRFFKKIDWTQVRPSSPRADAVDNNRVVNQTFIALCMVRTSILVLPSV